MPTPRPYARAARFRFWMAGGALFQRLGHGVAAQAVAGCGVGVGEYGQLQGGGLQAFQFQGAIGCLPFGGLGVDGGGVGTGKDGVHLLAGVGAFHPKYSPWPGVAHGGGQGHGFLQVILQGMGDGFVPKVPYVTAPAHQRKQPGACPVGKLHGMLCIVRTRECVRHAP